MSATTRLRAASDKDMAYSMIRKLLFEINHLANKKTNNERNTNAERWLRYVWIFNKSRLYWFRRSIWKIIISISMMVKICVPLIIQWEYERLGCRDLSARIDFLAETNSAVLLATNITEKMIKIVVLTEIDASTPLYEEKSIMLESSTTTAVKTSMKINELFLLSDNLA